jgi:hypothetical protein
MIDHNIWIGFDLVNSAGLDEFLPVIYIQRFGSERETTDRIKLISALIICSTT